MSRLGMFIALCGLTMGFVGCKSDAEKQCFDNPPKNPKHWVGACGEACNLKKNKKACAKMVEVANDHCIKKGNREVCRWMCEYSKLSGKDVYCKHLKGLDAGKDGPGKDAPGKDAPKK